jgi:CubicO group peptidase (beta-lactamase class C family)
MHTLRRTGAFLLALLTSLGAATAQSLAGRWSGSIEIPGSPLAVVVTLEASGSTLEGSIDIPAQNAKALPLTKLTHEGARVAFTIGGIPGDPTFAGTLEGDRLAGTFSQGGAAFPFTLSRASAGEAAKGAVDETARLDSIRAFLAGAPERWHVPGIGVAVVRDGKVILAEGFGLRDLERKLPVTANTLMPIGSTTKGFTAFIIGTLVAEGKLDWDTPVVEYLPEFRLADEAATRAIRVRDILTHVTGLPRHDYVWYGASLSRAELFERLRHLEASAPVRTKWQYQNLMYMTAGVLAERVSGRSWETLVEERIFTPLGMTSSTTSLDEMQRASDYALGYERTGRTTKQVDYRSAEAMGPAGSINSSAAEMARWLQAQIDGGSYEGRELIDPGALAEIHAPQVVMSSSDADERLLFNLYAMGWMQHAYRGRRFLQHGGNIDGFSSVAGFLPNEKIGVVVLANRGSTGLPTAAMLTILDILLDERDHDWEESRPKGIKDLDSMRIANAKAADEALRVPNTRPSHDIEDYVGEYEHPAYGTITVRNDRGLVVDVHGMRSKLEHYHYDVFRMTEGPEPVEGFLIEFRTARTGEIASIVAPFEPSVEPLEFKRRAPAGLREPIALERFVGEYELSGAVVTIARHDSTLIATVPGQPDYELVPTAEATFELRDLPGYSVKFSPRRGKVDRLVFVQPNGTFVARRKE